MIAKVDPHSPAADAKPAFEKGDKVVAIKVGDNTIKTDDFVQLQAALAAHRDEKVIFVVQRDPDKDKPVVVATQLEISVAPNPCKHLGVVMEMGPVTAVQNDSPADKAGIKPGDVILSIAGQPVGDPLRLPELVRPHAGQPTPIEVRRKTASGADATVALNVTPDAPKYFDAPRGIDYPWSCEELGVAYNVLNRVQSIDAGAPEAAKSLEPGDEIVSAIFIGDTDEQKKELKELELSEKPIEFDADHLNWPFLQTALQVAPEGAKVELKFRRGKEEKSATLPILVAPNWFIVQRGTIFEPLMLIRQANGWVAAFKLGARETMESVLQVAMVLQKLVSGGISPKVLGGPFTIAAAAADSASKGYAKLLLFLTLLSGNLAVINFLPIPVLDGGHMMFLLYEGVTGKPASEKTMSTLTYIGLVLILTLMVFVLCLDIPRMIQSIRLWFS